ncbi:S8 family serine peptidase [Nonomuraea sp. NPDC059023]|uniref:S8 family serine peptidase n=1 Tax=unclassified Nonomuraea TaxID=2593643 RepID=UPI00367E83BB
MRRRILTLALRATSALGLAVAAAAVPSGVAHADPPPGRLVAADPAVAIPDRYIVILKSTADLRGGVPPVARRLAERYGGRVERTYTTAVTGFSAAMSERDARRLAADPAVAHIEQDQMTTVADRQDNPPSWGLDRIDQPDLPLSRSYTYAGTAQGVRAYVIDTGIRISHADFGGRATYGRDLYDGDDVASDCNGHGTHVAGTIGGTLHGVAKKTSLIAVRVLGCDGRGPGSGVLSGVDWIAANGTAPAVVNVSVKTAVSSALTTAIQSSIRRGYTYVAAAANDNADACGVGPPSVPEVITAGAANSDDSRRSTSNWGRCLDLFAPGGGITSAWHTSDNATNTISGTSMASPHVAGAAALLLSAHPGITPAQIQESLVSSAITGKVTNAGSGSPNRLLHIPPATPSCGPFTDDQGAELPDRATVERSLEVTGCAGNGSTTSKVSVNIRHSYRGDLVLDLIAPDGTVYSLKGAGPDDSAADLVADFPVDLSAETRSGTWRLRVRDAYKGDAGTLTSWSLTL